MVGWSISKSLRLPSYLGYGVMMVSFFGLEVRIHMRQEALYIQTADATVGMPMLLCRPVMLSPLSVVLEPDLAFPAERMIMRHVCLQGQTAEKKSAAKCAEYIRMIDGVMLEETCAGEQICLASRMSAQVVFRGIALMDVAGILRRKE